MNHEIVYTAVKKKAETTPPNRLIGNVEMAAVIGIILKEKGLDTDFSDVNTPEEIKEKFLKEVPEDGLSEMSKILYEQLENYKPLPLLNEKIEDLHLLIKNNF